MSASTKHEIPPPILLKPEEAAQHVGIGRTAFYSALRRGVIPRRKFGKATLILREDLERFARSLPTTEPST